jgi:molybdopterin-guanine dinucleotide biosynthesis protein A
VLVRPSGTSPAIGIILAGGRGRRFGGIDKALLTLAGQPLIRRVVDRIAPQVGTLIINSNSESPQVRALGLPVAADRPCITPATGPLVGLTTMFAWVEERGRASSPLLSVPVDTPFLPLDLVARLDAALASAAAPAAYAASLVRDHPVIALWDARARHRVRALFDGEPDLSLRTMMQRLGAVRVVFEDAPVDPFLNINTADDLAAAQRVLSQPCEPASARSR